MSSLYSYLLNLKTEHNESYEHSIRCGNILAFWAESDSMNAIDIQKYREAGYAHDLGKLQCLPYVKSDINLKEALILAKNTGDEQIIQATIDNISKFRYNLQLHTKYGLAIVNSLPEKTPEMLNAVNYHHCRYNSNNSSIINDYCADSLAPSIGYNDILKVPKRNGIPDIAQKLCIIDTYDALKYRRCYQQKTLSDKEISETLRDNLESGQYNPVLFKDFNRNILPYIKNASNEELTKVLIMGKTRQKMLNTVVKNNTFTSNSQTAKLCLQ